MKFRYDINALRAIAVIGVVLFHFKFPFFDGGFAGVDIFFVISGYLMSKIIITGLYNDDFKIIDFYKKRANRIIPALLLLILFVLLVGQIIFFGEMQESLSNSALGSVFFVSNLVYYFSSSYFDQSSQYNILLHTWSLSVEWQFYILYPVLLIPLRKLYNYKRAIFELVIIGVTITSLLLNLYVNTKIPSLSFYSFPTRSWEMLLGCIVFLYEDSFSKKVSISSKRFLALFCYLLLAASFIFYDENLTWPGYLTLLPVIATSLILLCNYNFKILGSSIVNFLGKISYSLYLWHWPLYVIALFFGFQNNFWILISLIIISIGISYLSYEFIEKNKRIANQRTIILSMFTLGILALIPKSVAFNDLFLNENQKKLSKYQSLYIKDKMEYQFNETSCFLSNRNSDFNIEECLNIVSNKKNILLIGDSHAAQFSESLMNTFENKNLNLLQATFAGSIPFPDSKGKKEYVSLINYMYSEYIPENRDEIDLIIFSCQWLNVKKNYSDDEVKEKLKEIISIFDENKIEFVILGQTKSYKISYPDVLLRTQIFPFVNSEDFVDTRTSDINLFLKSYLEGKPYIDIYDLKSMDVLSENNEPYVFDGSHYSVYGTDQVVNYLNKELNLFDF